MSYGVVIQPSNKQVCCNFDGLVNLRAHFRSAEDRIAELVSGSLLRAPLASSVSLSRARLTRWDGLRGPESAQMPCSAAEAGGALNLGRTEAARRYLPQYDICEGCELAVLLA